VQKAFDLIVFDWDGTLMDSEAHIITSMPGYARSCGSIIAGGWT
jgi:beta-phosphoglucomutase-like phosphatase (HAD superfamily)